MEAKKSLGQHFLMHAQTASRIAEAAGIGTEDTVLEIGPGTGKLTGELLKRAGKVIAIETDTSLVPGLVELFDGAIRAGTFKLIPGDVREFDPGMIEGSYRLVANIPYYITGEIIRMFLTAAHPPESMTLLVQKEVAERIARAKKESLLSVSVKVFGTPKYEFTVPAGAFVPAPAVDSAVLSVRDIRSPFEDKREEEAFFSIVRAGFRHKRKLLAGNLSEIAPKEAVLEALKASGVDEKARAEDVSVSNWQDLARNLASFL